MKTNIGLVVTKDTPGIENFPIWNSLDYDEIKIFGTDLYKYSAKYENLIRKVKEVRSMFGMTTPKFIVVLDKIDPSSFKPNSLVDKYMIPYLYSSELKDNLFSGKPEISFYVIPDIHITSYKYLPLNICNNKIFKLFELW